MGQSQEGRRHYSDMAPVEKKDSDGGEEGEEVDLRANGEATREAKGVGEQEEQAVYGEAKGPTKRQHKGLRPRNGRGLSSLNNWKNMSNYPILKYNWTAVLIKK